MTIKPLLISLMLLSGTGHANEADFSKPEVFTFGSSVNVVRENLEPLCTTLTVQKIEPITAPLAKESQRQINCAGFVYACKKRKLELVFQDDKLDLVWILFAEQERQLFIDEFKSLYGEPSMEIDYGTIFLHANSAIRNKPPEVLFASDRQVQVMLKQLAQQSPASETDIH